MAATDPTSSSVLAATRPPSAAEPTDPIRARAEHLAAIAAPLPPDVLERVGRIVAGTVA